MNNCSALTRTINTDQFGSYLKTYSKWSQIFVVKITHVAAKTTPISGVFQSHFHRLSEFDFTDFEVRARELAEPYRGRL